MAEIDEYDYPLPKELIAQMPLRRRTDSRLMLVDRQRGSIDHFHFRNLPALLNRGDCLVLNDTKVLLARLVGYRTATQGRWYGLFLDVDEHGLWRILAKTRGNIKPGETVTLQDREGRESLVLEIVAKLGGGEWAVKPISDKSANELLADVGRVPLPHYIRGGEMVDADIETYQTVFAREAGAVAAPTAGLHFTPELLEQLESDGVRRADVTLHVGIGTFRPIAVDRLEEHQMHSEQAEISPNTCQLLNDVRDRGGRIIAVGTTAVRTLETAAASGELAPFSGNTNLFIRPGHQFHGVDALITNFHLPRSTLLVLVRAFGGAELMKEAYRIAVREEYRFFSYGDAMLII